MLHLLQLEWKKISTNRAFKVSMGMYVILLPLLYLTIKRMMKPGGRSAELAIIESFYQFPNIWETVSYWASWLTFFLLIYLAVWMVTSEQTNKTMRQNLITGMNRKDYLLGKLLMMLSLNLFVTLYMALVGYAFGMMAGGYGNPFGKEISAVYRFFVQNLFYMNFAFLLAIVFKGSGLAMIIFFSYTLIIERIIRYLVFGYLMGQEYLIYGSYLPASTSWDVVPFYFAKKVPSFLDDEMTGIILDYDIAMACTMGYTLLFMFISYRVFMSRDL